MIKAKEMLASEVSSDEMKLIDEACRIEERKRANFVRVIVVRQAKEVIEQERRKNGRQ